MATIKAIYRFARISPRKVRQLADLVRNRYADEAFDILKYQPHRGARMLEKVIQSAVGNAQNPEQNKGKAYSIESLVLRDVRIDGGPMFKRIQPRARGMAFTIKKRMSHITVGLVPIDQL